MYKYIVIGHSNNLYYIEWNDKTVIPQNVLEAI